MCSCKDHLPSGELFSLTGAVSPSSPGLAGCLSWLTELAADVLTKIWSDTKYILIVNRIVNTSVLQTQNSRTEKYFYFKNKATNTQAKLSNNVPIVILRM